MIANPKKFQAVIISKKKNALPRYLKLQINNTETTPQPTFELLGVTIDNELKFDQHISRLCKSAECQLNAGAITKFKKSFGWIIDKFWLNNSLVINGTI